MTYLEAKSGGAIRNQAQGLKPGILTGPFGTAKAVPSHKTIPTKPFPVRILAVAAGLPGFRLSDKSVRPTWFSVGL